MGQPRGVPVDEPPEPPQLRRLRWLVSLLMVVLIAGMIVVAGALVLRLGTVGGSAPTVVPVTAEQFSLPAGAEVLAVGQGEGGVMIVTRDAAGAETLRILDPATGAEKSATPITRE